MQAPSSLDDLCQDLLAEFGSDPRGPRVAARLSAYQAACQDWRPFTFFAERSYTRNLVHRCGAFELLLLGWNEGQQSPIHDHANQSCWMAVLDGDLEEIHYKTPATGGIVEGRRARFAPGQVAFIDDKIAFHQIRPLAGRAVSLHLYSNPIDRCQIFCPDSGQSQSVDLGYYSLRGTRCDHEDPAQVRKRYAASSPA